MLRRNLLVRISALFGVTLPLPALAAQGLSRINAVRIGPDRQQPVPCNPDVCTERDSCDGDSVGHVCQTRDVCQVDGSGDCNDDQCTSDSSFGCTEDGCIADKSAECAGDSCQADSSGGCTRDACISDSSGDCTDDGGPADDCIQDLSGPCGSDSSGGCEVDSCLNDSSKECGQDSCQADASGECEDDVCAADSSGACETDSCVSDSSGGGRGDSCVSDSSGYCDQSDVCASDSSGECMMGDSCTSDSSGGCETHDSCVADSSKACLADSCGYDSSGFCEADSCTADQSGACVSDLCRSDKSDACGTDSCARDVTADTPYPDVEGLSRLNHALRWLYRLSLALLVAGALARAQGTERVVIDLGLTALLPAPQTVPGATLASFTAAGPFLADFDGDGVLEADIDADGFEASDPEVRDDDGDGTRELPAGTIFQGRKNYTYVWSPPDVLIRSSGPLEIYSLTDIRVFGAVRLAASTTLAARGVVDLRASAWLMEDAAGTLTVRSGLAGVTGLVPPDLLDESGNLLDVADSDQDGASDADEGTADADADGVPDWLDQDTVSVRATSGFRSQADLDEGPQQRLDWTHAALLDPADTSLPASGRPSTPFPFGLVERSAVGVTPGATFAVSFSYPISIPSSAQFWGINRSQAWVSLSLTASGSKRVLQVQDGGPLDLDGQADGRVTFRGGLGLAPLFFSQFGDGLGQLSSQILVLNLDTQGPANVDFRLTDDGGAPLATDLDGANIQGEHSVVIPAGGLSALATDGVGDLKVGSVAAYGDRALSGVIVFRGPAGVAGVGAGEVLSEGFVAPVESNAATGVDTGIAVMNLSDEERLLSLTLLDPDGQSLATAHTEVAGLGHLALFTHQFTWQPAISFANFTGLLRVGADGSLAATVLQTRPGEFVTLPVVPLGSVPATGGTLYFAHFGAGLDLLGSQIILFNRHETASAQATLTVRDDQGKVPSMSLNGVTVGPQVQVTIPPKGLRVLSTGSQGDLVSGSVRVTSPQPLAGVIVFSGSVGAAGVGSSPRIERGFSAPMETDRSRGLNTGVALMNAGTRSTTLSLSLYDASGHRLARATVNLPVNGHKALFVDQFQWDTTLDFTRFQGILKVAPSDPISATVLQTRPGQFATMPVAVTP